MSAPGQGGRDGSDRVWGLISTLVAGPAVWGAIGYGVDRLAGTEVALPIGVVVGFVTSFYIVYATHGRDQPADRSSRGRSAPRPDSGDDAPA